MKTRQAPEPALGKDVGEFQHIYLCTILWLQPRGDQGADLGFHRTELFHQFAGCDDLGCPSGFVGAVLSFSLTRSWTFV